MCRFTKALKKNFGIDQDKDSCNPLCRYRDEASPNNCFLEYMEEQEDHEHTLDEIRDHLGEKTRTNVLFIERRALDKLRSRSNELEDFIYDEEDIQAQIQVEYYVDQKLCVCCGETKSAADFPRNRASIDGLALYCKACGKLPNKSSKFKVKEYREGTKHCTKCKEVKSRNDFSKNRAMSDGLNNWCKKCLKAKYLERKDKQ